MLYSILFNYFTTVYYLILYSDSQSINKSIMYRALVIWNTAIILIFLSQAELVEETYCSDEIEVVLVDTSSPGPSTHVDNSDTVKIIITMSCDPQTATQLEESVKQSLLENAQVRPEYSGVTFPSKASL